MSAIFFTKYVPNAIITDGAIMATTSGTGSVDIVFADLIGVAQSRIKLVMVGNTAYRMSGDNPEITAYDSTTGTFTCFAVVDIDIPCVAFYTPS